jgi:hypothetical protein
MQDLDRKKQEVLADPACWSGFFDNIGLDPLHLSFLRLKILNSNINVMAAIESLILIMVFIETDLQCDYYQFYVRVMIPSSVVVTIIYLWASGVLADNTDECAPQILGVFSIAACFLDPIFFYFSFYSRYLTVVIFLIRNCIVLQISVYSMKLFKMRLVKMGMREEHQVPAYLNLTIWTDIFSRFAAIITLYGVTYYLLEKGVLDFEACKFYYFAFSMFWDIITVIISFSIKKDYYYIDETLLGGNRSNDGNKLDDGPCCNPKEFIVYFLKSTKKFFSIKLLVHSTLLVIMYALLLNYVLVVLRFQVIESTNPDHTNKTKENFCGNEVINLVQNQTFQESFRLIGTVVFIVAFVKMLPIHFFRRASHLVNVFQMACLVAILFLPPNHNSIITTWGSTFLAAISTLIFLNYNYMISVLNSVIDPEIVGYVNALQGSMTQLTGLIVAATGYLLVKNTTCILLIIGFGVVMVYHFYIAKICSKEIKALDDKGAEKDYDSCFKTVVLGYGMDKYG